MQEIASRTATDPITLGSAWTGPACVLSLDLDGRRVQVQPSGEGSDMRLWSRMAAPGLERLRPGDEVLVTATPGLDAYVIGVLSADDVEAPLPARSVALSGGASAIAVDDTRLRLLDEEGRLLFEYDAASGRSRLQVPPGGLEVDSGSGDLALTTAGDLRLAAQTVQVDARVAVRLGVGDQPGRVASGLRLSHRGAHLFGASLEVLAGRARLLLREVLYQGARVEATMDLLKVTAERVESSAETIISRARNVYRTVVELSQLRTGRQRTEVEEAAHLRAGRMDMRAREDVTIDGERIHLG